MGKPLIMLVNFSNKSIFIFLGLLFLTTALNASSYVTAKLEGRLGNQLFQIAAATSLALKNSATPTFPALLTPENEKNRKHVLGRVSTKEPSNTINYQYSDYGLGYKPIHYQPNMTISGWYASEFYFKEHKSIIYNLFAPSQSIQQYLNAKYSDIIHNPNTVAIHVRAYYPFAKNGKPDGKGVLPFVGWKYYKRAAKKFPKQTLFVVFSDNINFAEKGLKKILNNAIFIKNEPYYHDFYLMSLCKHNIIANSTFSWWAAYLNKNPEKKVIAPKKWHTKMKTQFWSMLPEGWIKL